jgi:RNA polymerase sigma factor (TIGR02999 family)
MCTSDMHNRVFCTSISGLDMKSEQPANWDALTNSMYEHLLRMAENKMRHEDSGHTLQATALVHEVYMKLESDGRVDPANRRQFFNAAANAMRQVLIDHAKIRKAAKRGGRDARKHKPLGDVDIAVGDEGETDPDKVLALNAALDDFAKVRPRAAEVVKLRYFAGLTEPEVAEALDISESTVKADFRFARAWLAPAIEKRLHTD